MSFLLRPGIRAAAPLRQHLRSYATEPPKAAPSSSSAGPARGRGRGLLWLGVGAGLLTYFYLQGPSARRTWLSRNQDIGAKYGYNDKGYRQAFTGGDQGFVSLVLDHVDVVNHNTKRLRFKLPRSDDVLGLHVASAVLTKFTPVSPAADGGAAGEQRKPVVRQYTPVSDEDAVGYMDLLVKKYPDGPMSTHLHDMVAGQRLDVKGPLPKYPWTANKHEHIVLVAGGTGITPMWQLCRAIFKNPADQTKVTLVSANVSEDDILLKRELAELENTYPQRFRAFYVVERPPEGWAGATGRVSKDVLKTVLPEPKEGANFKVFVCGPPGMMKAVSGEKASPKDQGEVSGILKELGFSKEQVYKF